MVEYAIYKIGVTRTAIALGVPANRLYRWMRKPELLTDGYRLTIRLAELAKIEPRDLLEGAWGENDSNRGGGKGSGRAKPAKRQPSN